MEGLINGQNGVENGGHTFTESYINAGLSGCDDGIKTISECLKHYAQTQGDTHAMIFAATSVDGVREVVTWSDLYEKASAVARSLVALGVKRDEVVGINIRQCPEWLYMAYGAVLAGATVASISFTYKDGSDLVEVVNRLQTCSLLALDTGANGENWQIVNHLLDTPIINSHAHSDKMSHLRYLIGHRFPADVTGIKSVQDLVNADNQKVTLPANNENDVAFLLQTSGSTGHPKLVAHTHRSLLATRKNKALIFSAEHIFFNDRPFNWVGGVPCSVLYGQTRVTMSGFGKQLDAASMSARCIDVIVEEGCGMIIALPPRLDGLINAWSNLPNDWSVEAIITGGQPITKHLAEATGKICKTLGCSYGSTECIVCSEVRVSSPENIIDYTCGKPVAGSGLEIKVVGPNGEIVPVNNLGEMLIRTPCMFSGYYNDEASTTRVLSEDGWYRTDDMVRMNENGEIFFEGRKSNMILSGGTNVTPEILEREMKACPGIAAVVIVPIPDEVYYQVICACVMVTKGSNIGEDDIRRYFDEIENYDASVRTTKPKYYMFVDSFPTTHTGKLCRKTLKAMAEEKFAA